MYKNAVMCVSNVFEPFTYVLHTQSKYWSVKSTYKERPVGEVGLWMIMAFGQLFIKWKTVLTGAVPSKLGLYHFTRSYNRFR